ncbi:unnamed protein product [Symbiodinium natans]|uniref:Uncharacterized protein n=1 Tax=Symbiodinium natans TaxID=878477 RepID=A0A812PM57_9DINO|nr:unnamed protein product [Symbiodinium natans]
MPFVPISSRKPHTLLLDHEKARMRTEMRIKDQAVVAEHYGLAPSSGGYRFGNHPLTRGPVRGPDVPFQGATAPWKPSDQEPQGPMAQLESKQAKVGAYWDGAHQKLASIRHSHSSPALRQSAAEVMQACHPLTTELNRWKKLADVTEKGEVNKELQESLAQTRTMCQAGVRPKPVWTGGLVNFPKYMLFNNCHLKQMDLQRFADQHAAPEESEGDRGSNADIDASPLGEGSVRFQEPSWGAPLLKNKDSGVPFAGSAMPSGRACRTSNALRMG